MTPELTGRLGITLTCGRQILSLLKSANARPCAETEDAINLPAVLSLVLQSLLHLLYVVRMRNRRDFLAEVGAKTSGVGRRPEMPVASNRKTIAAEVALPARNISFSSICRQEIDSLNCSNNTVQNGSCGPPSSAAKEHS